MEGAGVGGAGMGRAWVGAGPSANLLACETDRDGVGFQWCPMTRAVV